MTSLTLVNVRPWGGAPVDLVIVDGVVTSVVPTGSAADGPRVDGRGLLALPGFVNAHAHVDKSWWGQPWVSYGGEPTTQGRIAHERAERDKYGIPSVAGTGSRADVVLLDAENVPDAVVRAPRREIVVAGGQVVVRDGQLLV